MNKAYKGDHYIKENERPYKQFIFQACFHDLNLFLLQLGGIDLDNIDDIPLGSTLKTFDVLLFLLYDSVFKFKVKSERINIFGKENNTVPLCGDLLFRHP